MWYAVHAQPGAEVLAGLKPGVTPEIFKRAIEDGSAEDCLRARAGAARVKRFLCPPVRHTPSAPALVLCEIQEYSDLTYRVFDYNRRDAQGRARELHIEKALQVMRFGEQHGGKIEPVRIVRDARDGNLLCRLPIFRRGKMGIRGNSGRRHLAGTFRLLIVSGRPRLDSVGRRIRGIRAGANLAASRRARRISSGAARANFSCSALTFPRLSMNSRASWPLRASAKPRCRAWCIREKARCVKSQIASRMRRAACRRARHSFLAAQPHAHAEATAEHRRRRDHAARNRRAPGADFRAARFLGGDQYRTGCCGAARASRSSGCANSRRACRSQYRRGDRAWRQFICGTSTATR